MSNFSKKIRDNQDKEVNKFVYRTIHCPVCDELIKVSKFNKKVRKI